MDKGQEMPQLDSTVPSAPPSYEEAIAQSGFPPNLPRNPPYPTGGPQMPMPTPCKYFSLLLIHDSNCNSTHIYSS